MSLGKFAPSRALTVGVELELQLVNTHDYDLVGAAEDLLRLLARRELPGEVKPEMTDSMIEVSTGVCDCHGRVLAELEAIRDGLAEAARRLNIGICGGGTHPFQDWNERRIFDAPRFRYLHELYGYLAKQFTVFGQHVHVGCPGPDVALYLLHGLSRYVPQLIALSASSPFVQGGDTGFQSARLNSVFAFPLSGRAPFVESWCDFEAYFEANVRARSRTGRRLADYPPGRLEITDPYRMCDADFRRIEQYDNHQVFFELASGTSRRRSVPNFVEQRA